MSHLSLETIARLVDDEPDTAEAAHLSSCAECRSELEAMTEDVHALSMLPDMDAAPDQWDALEQRLMAEGLIRTPPHRFGASVRMMQIAAALVLFVGGAMAGRMTAQQPTAPLTATAPADTRDDLPAPSTAPSASLAAETAPPAERVRESPIPEPGPRSSVSLASSGGMDAPRPGSMDDAAQFLRAAEALYLEALTGYAEQAADVQPGDPVARLAALQSIIMTTQAALNETPTDPVINGYHLTALAQRDATLRQVAQASSQQWH